MRAVRAEGSDFVCREHGWKLDGNCLFIGICIYCWDWNGRLLYRCGADAGNFWNSSVLS